MTVVQFVAWFFMVGIMKFSIDLKTLLLPFPSVAPKMGLVVFFLLGGWGSLPVDARSQRAEPMEVDGRIDESRNNAGPNAWTAPYMRGGAKVKKTEKRAPDSDLFRPQPPVDACHFILTDMLNRRRYFFPVLGCHDHLHRQALF